MSGLGMVSRMSLGRHIKQSKAKHVANGLRSNTVYGTDGTTFLETGMRGSVTASSGVAAELFSECTKFGHRSRYGAAILRAAESSRPKIKHVKIKRFPSDYRHVP